MKNWFAKLPKTSFNKQWLKVMSLLIAVICWYGIQGVIQSGSTVYETSLAKRERRSDEGKVTLPINVIAPTSHAMFRVDLETDVAQVGFRGLGHQFAGQSTGKISLVVDCSDISATGRYRLPIKYIAGARDEIIDIDPATVIVNIEFVE